MWVISKSHLCTLLKELDMRYMVDPPSGWKYGFPKALPEEAIMGYGGNDYRVKDTFNINEWLVQEGYSKEEIEKCGEQFWCRYWIEKE
jgi:hypothetical protein